MDKATNFRWSVHQLKRTAVMGRLAQDLPYSTVFWHYKQWRSGCWNDECIACAVAKKTKWTRLLIIDSQAVKNTCHASIETKSFVTTKCTNGISPSRGRYVGTTIYALYKANITDDQGLIELLSHNLVTFAQTSQHSKITILLDHGYHPIP